MAKFKVFVTRSDFPECGLRLLRAKFDVTCYPHAEPISRDHLLKHIHGASGVFCMSTDRFDKHVLDAAGPQLKVIATMSLGFDNIDIEECKKRQIHVCNAPNPLSVSVVAEFTVGLLLAVARKIVDSAGAIERGEWTQVWTPTWFLGRGLTNSTIGIVGMGRIGRAVLKRILPFDVAKTIYFDVFHPVAEAESLGAVYAPFEELLKSSDFVIVTCNLTEESRHMFDSKAFSLMKPTALFINASRGGVVDQDALVDALKKKTIKAAGIDVMYPEPLPRDHELAALPNVVITPHIAAAEETAMANLCQLTAQNIIEVLEGRKPITSAY